MNEMQNLHERVRAAVTRTVTKAGVSEKEAFARHMKELMSEHPATARAYMLWLMAK